jgi:nucleotide-binding universal stress UspA family protein
MRLDFPESRAADPWDAARNASTCGCSSKAGWNKLTQSSVSLSAVTRWQGPTGGVKEAGMTVLNLTGRKGPAEPPFLDGAVAVCIDQSQRSGNLLPHALAVTGPFGIPATLVHVLDTGRANNRRADPIEWELLRREARETLERLAEASGAAGQNIDADLIEGRAAEQICRWARDHAADLVVLGTCGDDEPNASHLGKTARDVIDTASVSILLVPPTASGTVPVRYHRILVALDGSSAAESVIPHAIRIAEAHDAELLLVHVASTPELTEIGPAEAEDIELCERLAGRNERVARLYLDRLKARVAQHGIDARALVLSGDVRSQLMQIVTKDDVDLVVLSAKGRSNRSDVPYGSVTSYLMTRVAAPILVVRTRPALAMQRRPVAGQYAEARLPSRALS